MNTPPIISPQPPPLPPASPTKKPFAFQAAQASFLAPLISIGIGFFVNVIGSGGHPSPLAGIITGSLCSLLIVLGLLFGIIALFGIRRYGKKGILGRAIAGILINGLLLFFMSLAIIKIIEHRKSGA